MAPLSHNTIEELLAVNQQQPEMILFIQQEILVLQEEIQRLKNGGNPPSSLKPALPEWVKPNVSPPSAEKPLRKPRSQGFVRHRETATEEVEQ